MISPLVSIETKRIWFEIHGPQVTGLNRAVQAHFSVKQRLGPGRQPSTDFKVRVQDVGASPRPYSPGATFSAFIQEETTYRVSTEALVADGVQIRTRDPRVFKNVRPSGRNSRTSSGEVNFEGQVGLFEFTLTDGTETWDVTVEVFPSKLDYRKDYAALVDEVDAAVRALALSTRTNSQQTTAGSVRSDQKQQQDAPTSGRARPAH